MTKTTTPKAEKVTLKSTKGGVTTRTDIKAGKYNDFEVQMRR